MKAYKLKFTTYDQSGDWDRIYLTEVDVQNEYNETKKHYENDNSFEEYTKNEAFGADGISCQWYKIEIHGDTNKPLIYLASPYTGNEEENFQKVSKKAAELMSEGLTIFSPIAMCHPMSVHGKLPGGWEFWEKFDRSYLSVCNRILVYRLPEWEKSKGVTAEIKIAQELGIPVEYID